MLDDQVTATRATLSDEWRDRQRAMDWMAAPEMPAYVNGMVSGRPIAQGGHWSIYAAEKHVKPLAEQLGRPLRMLSIGCGDAHVELSLIQEFGWPINEMVGVEYDAALRGAASNRFASLPQVQTRFEFGDFNALNLTGRFDILFVCHALHHATDLESFFPALTVPLAPHGLFIGIDYFGPNRFQVTPRIRGMIDHLHASLPPHLRRDLRDGSDLMRYATAEEVIAADPSEAPRSEELRTFMAQHFDEVETKPMGGTLLRWLLQYRAGNFDHNSLEHRSIASLLQAYERDMISSGAIHSDDLFFVCKPRAG